MQVKILTIDGLAQIGSIKKDYSGFVREMVGVMDSFSIKCKFLKKYFELILLIL